MYLHSTVHQTNWTCDPLLKSYILSNIERWHAYAVQNDHDIQEDEIIFVTGCDKTTKWNSVAYSGHSRGGGFALNAGFPGVASTNLDISRRAGRTPIRAERRSPGWNTEPNQCIFLRSYKVKRRNLGRAKAKGKVPVKDTASPGQSTIAEAMQQAPMSPASPVAGTPIDNTDNIGKAPGSKTVSFVFFFS